MIFESIIQQRMNQNRLSVTQRTVATIMMAACVFLSSRVAMTARVAAFTVGRYGQTTTRTQTLQQRLLGRVRSLSAAASAATGCGGRVSNAVSVVEITPYCKYRESNKREY